MRIWLLVGVGSSLGAVWGSFLATLVIRWPDVQSIVAERSRCDQCGTMLSARELLPLASYFLQRARARCCGASIDLLHPTAEALAGAVGLVSFSSFGWEGYSSAIFGWLLLALAIFDIRHFILPDWLNGLLLLVGLTLPMPEAALPIVDRLIGVVVGYASLTSIALLYRKLRDRDGLGGGDAKLLAGIGAWVGWQSLPTIVVAAGMLGFMAVAILKLSGSQIRTGTRLPLGTFLAAATWPVWMQLQITA